MTAASNIRILDQRTPEERDRPFLPGMGRTWLLPLYDVFTRVAGIRALHERAVELAGIAPGHTVVDVGCGTGNLSFAVLAAHPDARVSGLDPDVHALRTAARRARRRCVSLTLVQGYADRIPAEDASLDHVVSSLALHHVDDDGRVAFACDALLALRPKGKVTVVDFGGPASNAEDAHHPRHGHGPAHAVRHLPRLARSRISQSRPWPATSATTSSRSSPRPGSPMRPSSSTSTTGSAGSPSCRRPAPRPVGIPRPAQQLHPVSGSLVDTRAAADRLSCHGLDRVGHQWFFPTGSAGSAHSLKVSKPVTPFAGHSHVPRSRRCSPERLHGNVR